MMKPRLLLIYLLCGGLLPAFTPVSQADPTLNNSDATHAITDLQSREPCSYRQQINNKALRAVANYDASLLEIPKNVVNVYNDDEGNIFYALTGGVIKGVLHTAGRISTSLVDFATLLIPTEPLTTPTYAWENPQQDTSYNDYKFDECPPDDAVIAKPDLAAVKPKPTVAVPPRPVPSYPVYDNNEVNPKLDTMFKEKMMK